MSHQLDKLRAITGDALFVKSGRGIVATARAAGLAYAVGGGIMTLCGVAFIFLGRWLADLMLPGHPETAALTGTCLRVTGFIQAGFAASMIFSGGRRSPSW